MSNCRATSFHVTYKAVDRELPELLTKHRPHALLMFGLASRTSYLRIETRARNAVTTLWPDADHARVRKGSISGGADAMMFGPHTAKLLRAADGTGVDARASRDAGSYLCNYLSWRAIEATCRRQRSPPRRLRACAAARARRSTATQGRGAPHHAGRTGRRRRSDAAGDGEADKTGGARARGSGLTERAPISAGTRYPEPFAAPCRSKTRHRLAATSSGAPSRC